jgi:cytochrome oxidase complex assembly protein 1
MTQPPYPILGEPATSSWRDRHPHWKTVVGALVLVLFFGGVGVVALFGNMAALRSSWAYRDALSRAQSDPRVLAALGEPVQPGRFFLGHFETRGQFGYTDFDLPMAGPRNHGQLSVRALEIRGQWEFRYAGLEIKGFPVIDLLQPETAK